MTGKYWVICRVFGLCKRSFVALSISHKGNQVEILKELNLAPLILKGKGVGTSGIAGLLFNSKGIKI